LTALSYEKFGDVGYEHWDSGARKLYGHLRYDSGAKFDLYDSNQKSILKFDEPANLFSLSYSDVASFQVNVASGALTLGRSADTDIPVTFRALNTGVFSWVSADDWFKFSDSILMDGVIRILFRDASQHIASLDSGRLDVSAAAIDLNTTNYAMSLAESTTDHTLASTATNLWLSAAGNVGIASEYLFPATISAVPGDSMVVPVSGNTLVWASAGGVPVVTDRLTSATTVAGTEWILTSDGTDQVFTSTAEGNASWIQPGGHWSFANDPSSQPVILFDGTDPFGLGITGAKGTYWSQTSGDTSILAMKALGTFPAGLFGEGLPPSDTFDYMEAYLQPVEDGMTLLKISLGPYIAPYLFGCREIMFSETADLIFLVTTSGYIGACAFGNPQQLFGGATTGPTINIPGAGVDYYLPLSRGSSGQFLQTDGAGGTTWATAPVSSHTLGFHSDVDLSSVSDHYSLTYDADTGNWVSGLPLGLQSVNSDWYMALTDNALALTITYGAGPRVVLDYFPSWSGGPHATDVYGWSPLYNKVLWYLPYYYTDVDDDEWTYHLWSHADWTVKAGQPDANFVGGNFVGVLRLDYEDFSNRCYSNNFYVAVEGGHSLLTSQVFALNLEANRNNNAGATDITFRPVRFFSRNNGDGAGSGGTITVHQNALVATGVSAGCTSTYVEELVIADSYNYGTVTSWDRIVIKNLVSTGTTPVHRGLHIEDLKTATLNYGIYIDDFTDDVNDWGIYNLARTYLGEVTHVHANLLLDDDVYLRFSQTPGSDTNGDWWLRWSSSTLIWTSWEAGSAVDELALSSSALYPATNYALSLGTSSYMWNGLYLYDTAHIEFGDANHYIHKFGGGAIYYKVDGTSSFRHLFWSGTTLMGGFSTLGVVAPRARGVYLADDGYGESSYDWRWKYSPSGSTHISSWGYRPSSSWVEQFWFDPDGANMVGLHVDHEGGYYWTQAQGALNTGDWRIRIDGSGNLSVEKYTTSWVVQNTFPIAASPAHFADGVKLYFGTGDDLSFSWNDANSRLDIKDEIGSRNIQFYFDSNNDGYMLWDYSNQWFQFSGGLYLDDGVKIKFWQANQWIMSTDAACLDISSGDWIRFYRTSFEALLCSGGWEVLNTRHIAWRATLGSDTDGDYRITVDSGVLKVQKRVSGEWVDKDSWS
jgi:hypothetical protein